MQKVKKKRLIKRKNAKVKYKSKKKVQWSLKSFKKYTKTRSLLWV